MRYDGWAATTDPLHKECVRANLQMLWDDKDPATGQSRWIYKKTQRGFYSVRQEQFLTDKERGADGEFGPEWGPSRSARRKTSTSASRARDLGSTRSSGCSTSSTSAAPTESPFVIPDFRVAELRNAVEKLEGDLCISRPAVAAEVGHPVPRELRRGLRHLRLVRRAGELHQLRPRPRPALRPSAAPRRRNSPAPSLRRLVAAAPRHRQGHPHPRARRLLAHHAEGARLHRRRNAHAARPRLVEHRRREDEQEPRQRRRPRRSSPTNTAPKPLRYYLMSDIATGKDADFSEERLIQRYNTDLANSPRQSAQPHAEHGGEVSGGELLTDPAMISDEIRLCDPCRPSTHAMNS